MCIFQKITFERYTTEPVLKPGYFQAEETAPQFRSRQFVRRKAERELNRESNRLRAAHAQARYEAQRVAER